MLCFCVMQYFPEFLKELPPEYAHINPYLMARTDGSVVDASPYNMEVSPHCMEIHRSTF